jgi:hypothetical protein
MEEATMTKMYVNPTELEKLRVDTIDAFKHWNSKQGKDRQGTVRFDVKNHYEIKCFGVTIDVTADHNTAEHMYNALNTHCKTLYHIYGGVKCPILSTL